MEKRFLKISVVTPSFNQGGYLGRTINSVLSQGYPNLEYIIIDGGSTNGTLDILKKYKDQIIYISEHDHGQADAVNKGFKMCTGEIIGWLNSDDVYTPDSLKAVAATFMKYPNISIVIGDFYYIDENDFKIEQIVVGPFLYKKLQKSCWFAQPSVFFRREIINSGFFLDINLNYCMDYDLWLRIMKDHEVLWINKPLSEFRIHKMAKTQNHNLNSLIEFYKVKKRHSAILFKDYFLFPILFIRRLITSAVSKI